MAVQLTEVEARVLGSLVEKSLATPEYYPMTAHAVMNACNQKSSREPVMSLDETTVVRALMSLRDKGLAWERVEAGSRVPKFAHRFESIIDSNPAERAALCVLMLRGPQTPGEIKSRSERLHTFQSPAEAESTMNTLAERPDGPLTVKLPRQTGRKESRYAHLLCGEVVRPTNVAATESSSEEENEERLEILNRLSRLEKRVEELEARAPSTRTPQ